MGIYLVKSDYSNAIGRGRGTCVDTRTEQEHAAREQQMVTGSSTLFHTLPNEMVCFIMNMPGSSKMTD